MRNNFLSVINKLRQGVITNKSSVKLKRTKAALLVINFLFRSKFISGYKVEKNHFIIFFRSIKGSQVIQDIHFLYNRRYKHSVTADSLEKLKFEGCVILSTSRGFLTYNEAVMLHLVRPCH